MTVFKDGDILSLEAPGAQVQKVGDMDAVLYMVLPGRSSTSPCGWGRRTSPSTASPS